MVDSSASQVAIIWVVTAGWIAFSSVFTVGALQDGNLLNDGPVLLFPALAPLVLYGAIYRTMVYCRYGRSELILDALPAPLGAKFTGCIRTKSIIKPKETVTVSLTCERRTRRRQGGDSKMKLDILWQDRLEVPPTALKARDGKSEIPVLFALPCDLPPAQIPKSQYGVHYMLRAQAKVPGVDYQTEFDVLVRRTAQTDPQMDEDAAYAESRKLRAALPRTDPGDLLGKSGVTRDVVGGAERYRFPPAQDPQMTFGLVLLALILGSVIAWAVMTGVGPGNVIFGGFLAFILVIAVRQVLSWAEVTVTPYQLTLRDGLLFFSKKRELTSGKIERLDISNAEQNWRTLQYQVVAWTHDRQKVPVGLPLKSPDQARQFKDRLSNTLAIQETD